MSSSQATAILNRLSENIILLESTDIQALAQIHTDLESLSDIFTTDEIGSIYSCCAGIIEQIILEEHKQPDIALENIGKCIENGLLVLAGEFDIAELEFPNEIMQKCRISESEHHEDGIQSENKQSYTLPPHIDEEIFLDFLSEQKSVMQDMESHILHIEAGTDNTAEQNLKRLIHTLKGEAGLLGLIDIGEVCHRIEDLFQRYNLSELCDILFEIHDWLTQTFKSYTNPNEVVTPADTIISNIENFSPKQEIVEVAEDISEIDGDLFSEFVNEANEHLDKAEFKILTLEDNPHDEEAINSIFRAFHTIKGACGFMGLVRIGRIAHECENLLDKARKKEIVLASDAIDVIFESVDMIKELIKGHQLRFEGKTAETDDIKFDLLVKKIQALISLKRINPIDAQEKYPEKRIGEILLMKEQVKPEDIEDALQKQKTTPKKLGEILVEDKKVGAKCVAQAIRSQKPTAQQKSVSVKETVKVDSERLDFLVDTIGELVIAESMVAQSEELRNSASAGLLAHINHLGKITRELQEMATSLRMVAVAASFHKMARLVRDLSKKYDKPIDFVTSGEDTELDKTVVDKIGDPLIHMIRNAFDHGIEADVEDRRKAGKPDKGRIELSAFHKAGNIHIQIKDDGRGLDKNAILKKAIERNIITSDENLSDKEMFNLIFHPGFSTAKTVTSVSGRGVGMDVVKKNIESLRGRVEIDSKPGEGSVFTIQLPLTLAIIDGMVVRCAEQRYILPTMSIVRSLKPENTDVSEILKRGRVLSNQGRLVAIFDLSTILDMNVSKNNEDSIIVIVESDGKETGLVVDEILNQQQVVIKSLGSCLGKIQGISGGTIMPDGRVGLILDVGGIVDMANGIKKAA